LSLLVTLTTIAGFILASGPALDLQLLAITAFGTLLSAAGINALNQWAERERDGLMQRTCNRPLPASRISPAGALWLAIGLSLAGDVVLALFVNLPTAGLAVLTQLIYVFAYTPLKTRDPICTIVGAVCGAIPPMMGWTAVTGRLEPGAWFLAALLFAWQVPHFLALAWLYREDYERGGYRMLPNVEPEGSRTFSMVVLYSLTLIPVGVSLSIAGITGWIAAVGSIAAGAGMLWFGYKLYRRPTLRLARAVFIASLVYLPVILGFMIADRNPRSDWQLLPPALAADQSPIYPSSGD
jgi:protoheme IX farnesyltransferase